MTIHEAVRSGDLSALDRAMAEIQGIGRWALYIAAEDGNLPIVRYLLDRGIAPEGWGNAGLTPLHRAAQHGHAEVILVLLDSGCSPDVPDARGVTPLAEVGRYPSVANEAALSVTRMLLERGASFGDAPDGGSPLFSRAAVRGNLPLIRLLADRGIGLSSTSQYASVLAEAAGHGLLEVVQYLMESGAGVIGPASTRQYASALTKAAYNGSLEVVRYLLESGADVNCPDDQGDTPLIAAVHFVAIVELLLSRGADVHACNKMGTTVLHLAAKTNEVPLVEYLLDSGADPNAADTLGHTPFSYTSDGEILRLFLRTAIPALPDGSPDVRVLNNFVRRGRIEEVRLLLETGVYGNLAVYSSTLLEDGQAFRIAEILNLLAAHGFTASVPTPAGKTPYLVTAAKQERIEIVRALLDAGAAINEPDKQGRTALFMAANSGRAGIVSLLLARGANPRLPDSKGKSPAMAADAKGKTAIANQIRATGG